MKRSRVSRTQHDTISIPIKKPRISRKQHEDKISDLPQHILHHIMSFLPTKDVVQTSILSKTWNSTWSSFPVSLEFDQYSFRQYPRYRNLKAAETLREFCNHVNNRISGLSARQASTDETLLHKFQITVNFQSSKRRLDGNLDQWIHYAVENNVKHLIVAYHATGSQSKKDGWRYAVPHVLLTASSSVETLDLFGCEFKRVNGIKFPKLRKLSLGYVIIDQETLESLICNSPLLEEINISSCQGFQVGRITAPNLLRAVLFLNRDQIVRINAPNLVSLSYGRGLGGLEGTVEASSNFKNVKELKLHDMDTTRELLEVIAHQFPVLEKLELERCWWQENGDTGIYPTFLSHQKIK